MFPHMHTYSHNLICMRSLRTVLKMVSKLVAYLRTLLVSERLVGNDHRAASAVMIRRGIMAEIAIGKRQRFFPFTFTTLLAFDFLDVIEVGREERRRGRIVAPNCASSTLEKRDLYCFKLLVYFLRSQPIKRSKAKC